MTKQLALILMSVGLIACSTVGKAPLDDAYYWPEKSSVTSQPGQPMPSSTTPAPTPSPVEFTNIQDTTVTIRIHK